MTKGEEGEDYADSSHRRERPLQQTRNVRMLPPNCLSVASQTGPTHNTQKARAEKMTTALHAR